MFFKNFSAKNRKSKQNGEKTVTIGKLGEDAAVDFLRHNGYTVIERNYRAARNEIDIIATDKKYIVFVEVKARTYKKSDEMPYGRPSSAVTEAKKRRTVIAANEYLRTHNTRGRQVRLDVIEVFLSPSPSFSETKEVYKINHIINAFGA